jgi:hypothetical protein
MIRDQARSSAEEYAPKSVRPRQLERGPHSAQKNAKEETKSTREIQPGIGREIIWSALRLRRNKPTFLPGDTTTAVIPALKL